MEYVLTKEETLLCARAAETAAASEYAVSVLPFVTPRERLLVHDALVRAGNGDRLFWWGGCRGCERTAAVFLPEWYRMNESPPSPRSGYDGAFDSVRETWFATLLSETPDLAEEIPIQALQITGSGFASLTHRDFLGSILALGVERSVLGDILVEDNAATVFVHRTMAPYIAENLTKIGRDTVKCRETAASPLMEMTRRYETISITAASPRIDGVVRALAGISREEAAERIRKGFVERNYMPAADPDRHVEPGDVLTIRGCGKFRIDETHDETKRGRKRILCRKYV